MGTKIIQTNIYCPLAKANGKLIISWRQYLTLDLIRVTVP